MATTGNFTNMLNEYLPNTMLKEELIKRDWLLSNVEKDNGWKTGDATYGKLIVPFKGAGASSFAYGELTDAADIAKDAYVRGEVASPKEIWGTMKFDHKDIMNFDGSGISDKTFLKLLPDTLEDFMDRMKMVVSINLLNGDHFATLSADGGSTGTGLIVVDRPDRFDIGQKVYLMDGNTATDFGYVIGINMNTLTITLSNVRGGSASATLNGTTNLNSYTVAQSARCYYQGATTATTAFTSLKSALLSAANGGSATLYGVTKITYPYTQAINVSGSTVTATNILDKIFDAFTTIRTIGKGNPGTIVMSYKHWGSVLKSNELVKGAFNIVPNSTKVNNYGWTECQIGGVKGSLKVVAIQELDDDVMLFLDMRANVMKFYSNGFIKKRKSPDGREYFEQRATTGYSYLVDVSLFGEFVLLRPSYCGIMYGIAY